MWILEDNYQNTTRTEIAEVLGSTEKAVDSKAEELGIQKHHILTKREVKENEQFSLCPRYWGNFNIK